MSGVFFPTQYIIMCVVIIILFMYELTKKNVDVNGIYL